MRALLLCAIVLAGSMQPAYGQIILDGPNVTGTVGLNGETFGSGYVHFGWSGGGVQAQLSSGDNDFSVRVEPDKPLNVNVGMQSFQGGTNAHVYQYLNSIPGPSSSATTPLSVDFRRDSGRIIGQVSVVGGLVTRVQLDASKAVSSNEGYNANATATASPFNVVLPVPAASGVSVRGTAVLRADRGCEIPITLSPKLVDVPTSGQVTALWTVDLTGEQCNSASVQGNVTFNGLGDAVIQQRHIQVSGPVNRNQITDASGSYVITGLPSGSYYIYNYNFFNAPYSGFYSPSVNLSLSSGQLATKDFTPAVGTVHASIQPRGAWSLANIADLYTNFSTVGVGSSAYLGSSYDYADRTTGNVDIVAPVGMARLDFVRPLFYSSDAKRFTYQYFYMSFSGAFPLQGAVTQGSSLNIGAYQPETSESLVIVQPANTAVGLTTLRLTGFQQMINGSAAEYRNIDLYSAANGGTQPENSVAVLVRGLPGTYRMSATANGTDGATYSKQFDLTLGAPTNTPTGTGVVSPIEIQDEGGTSATGSITFGSVTTSGDTTVSASGTGPNAPGNFKVFGAGTMLYYDIRTTAQFDSATVCLDYDDASFASVSQERQLTLQHYVCADPQTNSGCDWEDITSPGFPDTVNNSICGTTGSFSIFAILQPLDQDGDGAMDNVDNCPAVPNADQADFDVDGIGDACDSDRDADGVDDTADNCPSTANASQSNLDNDAFGDACDADVDGDEVANDLDNCRQHNNSSQVDFDLDGAGDACDLDDDNDTVVDAQDSCPGTAVGSVISNAGCSSPQQLELVCPRDGAYRNHGQYVQCVAHEATRQVGAGLIAEQEKDAIVATAAASTVGK